MGYAIQMCEKQASGPPRVLHTEIEKSRPLDEVILRAKAWLDTAPVNGIIVVEDGRSLRPEAVFIRVVVDSDGSPTDQVVFEYP